MVFVALLVLAETICHWSLRTDTVVLPVATHRVVVVETPRVRERVWSAEVLLEHGQRIMLTAQRTETVRAGDALLIHAAVSPPRDSHNPGEMDYGTWLLRQGIQGTAYCPAAAWRCLGEAPDMPLRVRLLRLRGLLVQRYAQFLDGDRLAVLMAMTLGDRSLLRSEVRQDFSAAGASHILALSGLHLGILVSLFSLFLSPLLRRGRGVRAVVATAGVLLLTTFVLLAGAPLSLVRAALMLGIGWVCGVIERQGLSINNICLAAMLMLLWNPRVLFDVGFQLSFVAVAAIVMATAPLHRWQRPLTRINRMQLTEEARERCGRRLLLQAMAAAPSVEAAQQLQLLDFLPDRLPWTERLRIRLRLAGLSLVRALWSMAVVSLAAQCATMPLVAWHFHSVPVYGLLLNFILIPLTSLLLGVGLLFLLLPLPLLGQMLGGLMTVLLAVVSGIASWPGSSVRVEWQEEPPLVICQRFSQPELRCAEGQGQWRGNMFFSRYGKVVRVDGRVPRGVPRQPLQVDYLWLCRGAKGHLAQWLRLYQPRVIVLDATLSDYYYERFRQEAEALVESRELYKIYDIRQEGALVFR